MTAGDPDPVVDDTCDTACGRAAPAAGYEYVDVVAVEPTHTVDAVRFPVTASTVYDARYGAGPPRVADDPVEHSPDAGVHASVNACNPLYVKHCTSVASPGDVVDARVMIPASLRVYSRNASCVNSV